MAVPQNKGELLAAIAATYDKLTSDLVRVPVERARELSLPGHKAETMMCPADLVAYLIGWAEVVLSWHEQRAAGCEPDFPAPGYAWNELGELAQKFYRDHADESWQALQEQFASTEARIVVLVNGLSDEALYGRPWYGRYTAGRMIQLNTVSPYLNARRRIRAWLREVSPAV